MNTAQMEVQAHISDVPLVRSLIDYDGCQYLIYHTIGNRIKGFVLFEEKKDVIAVESWLQNKVFLLPLTGQTQQIIEHFKMQDNYQELGLMPSPRQGVWTYVQTWLNTFEDMPTGEQMFQAFPNLCRNHTERMINTVLTHFNLNFTQDQIDLMILTLRDLSIHLNQQANDTNDSDSNNDDKDWSETEVESEDEL